MLPNIAQLIERPDDLITTSTYCETNLTVRRNIRCFNANAHRPAGSQIRPQCHPLPVIQIANQCRRYKSIFSLVGLSESDGQAGDLQQRDKRTLVHWHGKHEPWERGIYEEENTEVQKQQNNEIIRHLFKNTLIKCFNVEDDIKRAAWQESCWVCGYHQPASGSSEGHQL